MREKTTSRKFLAISSISVLLSLLTVVLGAPLMRVLRITYGAWAYWILGAFVTLLFWFTDIPTLSIFVGSIWMTLGVYIELERKGSRWSVSAVTGIAAGSAAFAVGLLLNLKNLGIHNLAEAEAYVKQITDRVYQVNPELRLDANLLVQLIPSAVITVLIVALGIGLIFERRAFSWTNIPRERVASQLKLLEFRVPDFVIWIAMTAFLLTMENFNVKALEILALNIVNVATVLYFFQGLAVMEVFLRSFRAGVLIRAVTYVILIGQLLPFLSMVGLVDYWVDFRKRLRKLRMSSGNN